MSEASVTLNPGSDEHLHTVRTVFPPDTRAKVDPTTVLPYLFFGQLEIQFPKGDRGFGTGVLIDRQHVLTAAHNLYQNKRGGWAQMVNFSLARNANSYPYQSVDFKRLNVPDEYKSVSPQGPDSNGQVGDHKQYLYDYGVVTLQTALDPADGLFLPMYPADDETLNGHAASVAGYPGDKSTGTMWNDNGALMPPTDEFLFYRMSTFRGNSGSAVRVLLDKVAANHIPRIVGVHVAGSKDIDANFAVRLTQDVIDRIGYWL